MTRQTSTEIPVSKIDKNPFQPRRQFAEKPLRELMESIERNGLIQPIILREYGDRYQILAGERRFRAVSELGFPTISAIVRELSDEEMQVMSIIENIQREDLSAIEVARSYRSLIDELSYTQEQVASKLGKERSTVSNTLRLLDLPIEIQEDIQDDRISAGHGRALLPLKDSPKIHVLRDQIVKKQLSVREVERKVKSGQKEKKTSQKRNSQPEVKDAGIRELEEKLSIHLNSRVEIWGSEEGSIQIEFNGVNDFNRIFNLILESDSDDWVDDETDES